MSTPKTCPHSSGARAETHIFTGQCGLCERDAEIARLTAENDALRQVTDDDGLKIVKLQAVVDAAVVWYMDPFIEGSVDHIRALSDAVEKYRALDGAPCSTCGGRGYVPRYGPKDNRECPDCHGTGRKP